MVKKRGGKNRRERPFRALANFGAQQNRSDGSPVRTILSRRDVTSQTVTDKVRPPIEFHPSVFTRKAAPQPNVSLKLGSAHYPTRTRLFNPSQSNQNKCHKPQTEANVYSPEMQSRGYNDQVNGASQDYYQQNGLNQAQSGVFHCQQMASHVLSNGRPIQEVKSSTSNLVDIFQPKDFTPAQCVMPQSMVYTPPGMYIAIFPMQTSNGVMYNYQYVYRPHYPNPNGYIACVHEPMHAQTMPQTSLMEQHTFKASDHQAFDDIELDESVSNHGDDDDNRVVHRVKHSSGTRFPPIDYAAQ